MTRGSMLRFFLLFLLTLAPPLAAETRQTQIDIPACRTNLGDEGKVFAGMFAVVYAPKPFERMTSGSEDFRVYELVREGLGTLVYGGKKRGPFEPEGMTVQPQQNGARVSVRFAGLDGEAEYHCYVEFVEFDAAKHDPKQAMVGDCRFRSERRREGDAVLRRNVNELLNIPRVLEEVAVSDGSILDIHVKTDHEILMKPRRTGIVSLFWSDQDAMFDYKINICPFRVLP